MTISAPANSSRTRWSPGRDANGAEASARVISFSFRTARSTRRNSRTSWPATISDIFRPASSSSLWRDIQSPSLFSLIQSASGYPYIQQNRSRSFIPFTVCRSSNIRRVSAEETPCSFSSHSSRPLNPATVCTFRPSISLSQLFLINVSISFSVIQVLILRPVIQACKSSSFNRPMI